MLKKFSMEEIELAAQYISRMTGAPIELARRKAYHRAELIEQEQSASAVIDESPIILNEISAVNGIQQFWSSELAN